MTQTADDMEVHMGRLLTFQAMPGLGIPIDFRVKSTLTSKYLSEATITPLFDKTGHYVISQWLEENAVHMLKS